MKELPYTISLNLFWVDLNIAAFVLHGFIYSAYYQPQSLILTALTNKRKSSCNLLVRNLIAAGVANRDSGFSSSLSTHIAANSNLMLPRTFI